MYNIRLSNGSEFTIPKENLTVLAQVKAHDIGYYKIFKTDDEAIKFLKLQKIEVTENV